MSEFSFRTPEPVDLRVKNAAGTVEVTAADVPTSTVAFTAIDDTADAHELVAASTAELDGDVLRVDVPDRHGWKPLSRKRRVAVTVTVPTGSALAVKSASAVVSSSGRFASASVDNASGRVTLDRADGAVQVHLASGDVTVAGGGAVSVHSASGDVEIGHATGDVDVQSVSGAVRIGVAESSVRAKVVSGSLAVADARAGTVVVSATSGDLRVGVRRGVTARLDVSSMSGRIRSELPVEDTAPSGGAPLEVRARTISGSILITAATPA